METKHPTLALSSIGGKLKPAAALFLLTCALLMTSSHSKALTRG